ncbi:MAG: hypothetical protein HOP30_05205 [Cyclobacteriaceae bacterium]|nr:hypothetical protein [Cyclobacteriaceae bacterium]
MKTQKLFSIAIVIFGVVALTACEHQVAVKTSVHEDGSLDREIRLTSEDSKISKQNYFGCSEENGWALIVDSVQAESSHPDSSASKEKKNTVIFRKSYASIAEANAETSSSTDTLFHLSSKFEKHFRWFYTIYRFEDTYHPINRFRYPITDFLTSSDFLFIENLPSEGKPISKADSLFLTKLNERIFDHYFTRAYMDEYFKIFMQLADPTQQQKLKSSEKAIFDALLRKDTNFDNNPFPKLLDSLGIKIDMSTEEFKRLDKGVESKVNFMSWASEGKYLHSINMPGEIVNHNADSVAGNEFYWKPSYLKFAFKDYTLFVETKKQNIWAWIVSLIVIGGAAWGLRKKLQ